jgi:hypothetical protein
VSRVVAIDWSGRAVGASRYIWLAEAVDAELVSLECGRSRDEVIAEAVRRAPEVIGLDFAFGFPEWFARSQGWSRGREVWEATRDHGEKWLAACEPPFWGRPGRRLPRHGGAQLRVTDTGGAKSVFQIGGAGTVGTGSVRGMPHLLELAGAGYSIWPLEKVPDPRGVVVEIYPRLFTGPVVKSSAAAREAFLLDRFPSLSAAHRDAAVASEDAFDAAVTALGMSGGWSPPSWDVPDPARLEGLIWTVG